MVLPISVPVSPMLAKSAELLPSGDGWWYEPKWDGFRCIVERDDDRLELASRNERPLTRYFPELVGPLLAMLPAGSVVDGEIVVPAVGRRGLDFDLLTQRIHPAASRVERLAAETPALFVAFDLLAVGGRSLMHEPFGARRAELVALLRGSSSPLFLTPITESRDEAADWFTRFEGAGLDGIVAKRSDLGYLPGERVMVKVKHERTADCVVAGYRLHKDGNGVGSLLLGLNDADGRLHHVGVASSFSAAVRRQLLAELAPLVVEDVADHPWRDWALAQAHETARLPGGQSRWNAGKDLSFVAIRPEQVMECRFSQMQGNRFRHGTTFLRWRPDRDPQSCRYDQLEVAEPVDLATLLQA